VEEICKIRQQLGDAIWLWLLLCRHADMATEGEWFPIYSGGEVSDARIAVYLNIAESTARAWRVRLEKIGWIKSEAATLHLHRKLWVRNLDREEQEKSLREMPLPMPDFLVN
jgi:hypothetical protein